MSSSSLISMLPPASVVADTSMDIEEPSFHSISALGDLGINVSGTVRRAPPAAS